MGDTATARDRSRERWRCNSDSTSGKARWRRQTLEEIRRVNEPIHFLAGVRAATLFAHPMGNISANHYARFQLNGRGVELRYVLDLAEIPTSRCSSWKLEPAARRTTGCEGERAAQSWLDRLQIAVDGKGVHARLDAAELTIAMARKSAGGADYDAGSPGVGAGN